MMKKARIDGLSLQDLKVNFFVFENRYVGVQKVVDFSFNTPPTFITDNEIGNVLGVPVCYYGMKEWEVSVWKILLLITMIS